MIFSTHPGYVKMKRFLSHILARKKVMPWFSNTKDVFGGFLFFLKFWWHSHPSCLLYITDSLTQSLTCDKRETTIFAIFLHFQWTLGLCGRSHCFNFACNSTRMKKEHQPRCMGEMQDASLCPQFGTASCLSLCESYFLLLLFMKKDKWCNFPSQQDNGIPILGKIIWPVFNRY